MAWIREEGAEGQPAIMSISSLQPAAQEAIGALNRAISFGGSTLERWQEEAIATTVSVVNECRY